MKINDMVKVVLFDPNMSDDFRLHLNETGKIIAGRPFYNNAIWSVRFKNNKEYEFFERELVVINHIRKCFKENNENKR